MGGGVVELTQEEEEGEQSAEEWEGLSVKRRSSLFGNGIGVHRYRLCFPFQIYCSLCNVQQTNAPTSFHSKDFYGLNQTCSISVAAKKASVYGA